jgi:hypothetical protein
MIRKGAYGSAVISGIVFQTKDKTTALNGKRIKIIDNGALSLYELNDEIVIEIEEGVTTHQEVVDLMNGSIFEITATTSTPTLIVAVHNSGQTIQSGIKGAIVEFAFNKNLNNSISEESILAIYESLSSPGQGDLDFTHEIQDNKLIIKFS